MFVRAIVGVLVLLAAITVPLALLSANSFRSAILQQNLQEALDAEIGAIEGVELERYEIVSGGGKNQTLHLDIELKAVRQLSEQEAAGLQEQIAARLGRPVDVALSITPITRLKAPNSP